LSSDKGHYAIFPRICDFKSRNSEDERSNQPQNIVTYMICNPNCFASHSNYFSKGHKSSSAFIYKLKLIGTMATHSN